MSRPRHIRFALAAILVASGVLVGPSWGLAGPEGALPGFEQERTHHEPHPGAPESGHVSGASPNPVILLHGLARTSASMHRMQQGLEEAGFATCNIDYPSRKHDMEELARDYVLPDILDCLIDPEAPVDFVTHSMGGILVRYMDQEGLLDRVGRVVMLSPPNEGSEAADALGDLWLYKFVNGPAGDELRTDSTSLPSALGPPGFDVGIITGELTNNPILSLIIPGPDDGKVSIESARLEGMKDFLILPTTHTFIMQNRKAIAQSVCFLKTGAFCEGSA